MGEVKVKVCGAYLKFACIRQFTWLRSSPQFCTRNRERAKRDRKERGV